MLKLNQAHDFICKAVESRLAAKANLLFFQTI